MEKKQTQTMNLLRYQREGSSGVVRHAGPQLRCQWGANSDRPRPPVPQPASVQHTVRPVLDGGPARVQGGWGADSSKDVRAPWKLHGALIAQMPDAAQIQRKAGLDVRISLASLCSCRLAAAHLSVCHVL